MPEILQGVDVLQFREQAERCSVFVQPVDGLLQDAAVAPGSVEKELGMAFVQSDKVEPAILCRPEHGIMVFELGKGLFEYAGLQVRTVRADERDVPEAPGKAGFEGMKHPFAEIAAFLKKGERSASQKAVCIRNLIRVERRALGAARLRNRGGQLPEHAVDPERGFRACFSAEPRLYPAKHRVAGKDDEHAPGR